MADPAKFNLTEAASEDGTVNFYTLLVADPTTPVDDLRVKIQALYSESQANRDHRNLNRRREYQALLELLPAARTVLLDDQKRQSYDQYLAAARRGESQPDFETFMNDLMGLNQPMEEKTGLLGRADKPEVRASVIPAPPKGKKAPTPAPAASAGPPMGIIGGIGGFVLGFLIGYLALKQLPVALLIGVIVGVIAFVVLNKKTPTRVGR